MSKIKFNTLIIWNDEGILDTLHCRTLSGLFNLLTENSLYETILEDTYRYENRKNIIDLVELYNSNKDEFQFNLKLASDQIINY